MIKLLRQAYAAFLFWKWDREYYASIKRMRGCAHIRTMFVDVGSPPYDCIEKCRDCWAIRVPKLGSGWPTQEMEWMSNSANPRQAVEAK